MRHSWEGRSIRRLVPRLVPDPGWGQFSLPALSSRLGLGEVAVGIVATEGIAHRDGESVRKYGPPGRWGRVSAWCCLLRCRDDRIRQHMTPHPADLRRMAEAGAARNYKFRDF